MEVILDIKDYRNKKEILQALSKTLDLFNDEKLMRQISSKDDVYVSKIGSSNKIIFKKCDCRDKVRG